MQLKLKPAKGEHAGVSLTSGGSRAQLLHQGLTFSLLSLPFPLPVSSYLQVLLFFILASFSGSFPKAQQDSYQEFCTFLPPAKYLPFLYMYIFFSFEPILVLQPCVRTPLRVRAYARVLLRIGPTALHVLGTQCHSSFPISKHTWSTVPQIISNQFSCYYLFLRQRFCYVDQADRKLNPATSFQVAGIIGMCCTPNS